MKAFLYRAACGVVIGIGCVLPGVSGGIMAISMGLYERMVASVTGFFRDVRRNLIFLLPLAAGGGVGVLLTSNVLKLVIERYEGLLLALFAGLVLGSLPGLILEARGPDRAKPRKRDLAALFCGLACVLLFALGESSVNTHEKAGELTIVTALIAGGVLSVGTILPGISSSFILIYIGLYGAVLNALAGILDLKTLFMQGFGAAMEELSRQILPLVFMALGFAAVAILLLLGVNRALKRHHTLSYYAIAGFVIGSVFLILPAIVRGFHWLSPLFFLLGAVVSLLQFRMKLRRASAAPAGAGEAAPAEEAGEPGAAEDEQTP
ncbi:MAG: DUF368 domain-containing protein [Clostridia bacterium]|nr:DUF368 domain-containing protein [Clostridia bacterium]